MKLRECRMALMAAVERGKETPIAEVIVTAISWDIAKEYAEKELKPFIANRQDYLIKIKDLGKIIFGPAPTTIFLYTQSQGRLK
jgi:hypothetical protein